jgi:ABC-type nickel/cobalt efflux system permease component RcnA
LNAPALSATAFKGQATMNVLRTCSLFLVVGAIAIWSLGCNGSNPPKGSGKTSDAHGHDHDHDHDHAHHGPHGGHIIEIGKEEYHAEWTHDDDGTVTVYILDADMKKEVPIADEKVVIEIKAGENVKSYDLLAVNRTEGDEPKASQFEIKDKGLVGGLEALKGLEAALKVNINGKEFTAPITHEEHDHKH